MRDQNPIFYLEEAAEYEWQPPNIVARWRGGKFVMPVAVARKAVANLNRALDHAFDESQGKVIPMRGGRH